MYESTYVSTRPKLTRPTRPVTTEMTLRLEKDKAEKGALRVTADGDPRVAEGYLLARMDKAQGNLDQVNRRIDSYLASKRAEIVRVLTEEKAKLVGYKVHLAKIRPESKVVVGGVAMQNFKKVADKVYQVLVKADVGVLDVVWAIKNLAKGRYEKRESTFMKAMEMLKAKYREPRGVQ